MYFCMYVSCMCMYVHMLYVFFAAKSASSIDTYTYIQYMHICTAYAQHTYTYAHTYIQNMKPYIHFAHWLRCKMLCMYLHVSVYICMYRVHMIQRVHMCMYLYVYACICMYAVHISISAYENFMCICMYLYVCACIH